jgi:DHA1 family tetracycline resistance protein-like MFS transporter
VTDDTPPTDSPAAFDPAAGRRARLTVFLVVFIDLLGFGIVLPQLPLISQELLDPLIPGGKDSALAGIVLGLLFASFSGMQFLFAPSWGRLSDRIGRRPVLLLGLTGSAAFYALFGIGSEVGGTGALLLGLVLLFAARIGAGVAGATIAIAQATIADVTPPQERAKGMALIGAAFGIGFTFGPALGALMLWLAPDFRGGPGFLAAVMSAVALFICFRQMPETLRPDRRGGHGGVESLAHLGEVLRTPGIGLLVLCFFMATFAFAMFETTLAILNEALEFSRRANALVFTGVGLTLSLSAGMLVRRLAGRLPEVTMLLLGVAGMIIGLAGVGLTAYCRVPPDDPNRMWLLLLFALALVVTIVGFSFLNPSVQTLISKWSDPRRQGEYLGVNQSASALARVVGPAVGPLLFNISPTHMLPYVTATVLLAAVMLTLPRLKK